MARRNLTPQEFVDAAFALVQSEGMSALTARNLAQRMSVDPSAVYRHFENLEVLGSAALDKVFAEIDTVDVGDGSPRERLDAYIDRIHRAFVAHSPLLALALASATPMPHADRVSKRGLELLSDLGLSGDELVIGFNMIESVLMGMHLFDLAGAPHHFETRRVRWRRLENRELDRFATAADEVAGAVEASYQVMVEVLLDCCEALAANHSARR